MKEKGGKAFIRVWPEGSVLGRTSSQALLNYVFGTMAESLQYKEENGDEDTGGKDTKLRFVFFVVLSIIMNVYVLEKYMYVLNFLVLNVYDDFIDLFGTES